jgi:ADP-glucose pyrophosphorylase
MGRARSLNSNKDFLTQIIDSIVSHGCFLRDCKVEHSLIGLRSRLESGVEVKVGYYCPS